MNFLEEAKAKFEWKKIFIPYGLAIIFAVGAGLIWYFNSNKYHFISRPQYALAYSLVPDSISQSANIILTLPDGVAKDSAKSQITFTPEIKGEWLTEGRGNQLVYKPSKKLTLGHYYSVTLKQATGQIGKDFLVVEDPSVIAIFPKADLETHEKSNVTVLFNRPMVPVTTLDTLAEGQVPVSIEPKTEGRYKWIGTRTLQFIPNDHLKLSSNYTVKVASDIPSLDGIRVKGTEVHFSTRHLRKIFVTQGTTVYDDPVVVKFNQPVDLDRTAKEISAVNVTNNNSASEVVVEYGKNKVYNEKTNSYDTVVDESQLFIFNKRDQHGRAKLWDTTKQYTVTVAKAYPKEGDIIISESLTTSIQVTDVIAGVSATSPRSELVRPDLFDPKGKIVVNFFEDIDLARSSITADKLTKIEYGETCKEIVVGEEPDLANCEKITNKKSLVFAFDESQIKKGEKLNIQFKHLVNSDRVEINSGTITQTVTVVPELVVRDSKPSLRASGVNASLTYLTLCTNAPIFSPAKKDAQNYIKVYPEYEYNSWSASYYVGPDNHWQEDPCQVGDFETNINYGLMPETQYYVDLSLVDQFDGKALVKLNFKTSKMDDMALLLFHYQKGYNVTTPNKTELTYAAQNMEYVDVTVCQLSAESMLNEVQNYRDYRDPASAIPNCLSNVTRRIQLPKRYWIKNFFTVNLKDFFPNTIGHYVVTLSHPNYHDSENHQVYERSYVTVTNLSLVEKKVQIQEYPEMPESEKITTNDRSKLQNLYWVTNMSTLDPVPGAVLTFYSSEYDRASQKTINKKVGTANTDADGVAKASPVNMLAGAVVTSGNDSAILANNSQLQYSDSARRADRYYVYTDRPIYRPGDEISVKGITRVGYDGNFEILRDKPVNVIVYDSANTVVTSTMLSVSDFGTFNETFSLDSGAPLGTYRIEVDGRGYGFFDVEEYVSAAFKLEAKSDKEEYIAGDTAAVSIDANYYFGVPVEGGTVEYSIASQDYYFDKYHDEYFQFGSGWYSCYYDCRYGDQFILRNTVPLSQNGKATIRQPLDYKTLFTNEADRKSKIFVMYITVKDKTGKAVSTQKSFIVHGGEYYLGLNVDTSFLQKNQAANIKLKSVDTEGKPKSVGDITLSLRKIKYIQNQRQEVDGSYYYNWERKFDIVSENKISTDGNGNYSTSLTPPKEGEYELVATGTDKRGNVISTTYQLYVSGEEQVDVRPTNDSSLDLATEKVDLNVGDTGKVIIKSPYAKAKALIAIERGKIFSYKIVDLKSSLYEYTFKADESFIPNVNVSVLLLSSKPEVKFGTVYFTLNTKEKNLQVTVTSDKKDYLPGEQVKLHFSVKDNSGKPVVAEFSAAVVDESVLALKGNPKKNPVQFFYDGFPLTVATASNVKNILQKLDVPNGTKGGGGGSPEDLAKKKRGVFKDTAFWQAVLKTDANGQADAKFTLPDNLTSWQIEAVGVTKDTKLGVGYSDFMAKKQVMVSPVIPRFVVPGDDLFIGAQVFNQTQSRQTLSVAFSSQSLKLVDDKAAKSVTLSAGESKLVYFHVAVPTSPTDGAHILTLSAVNKNYNDTVEQKIKIVDNSTYEATATAGYGKEPNVTESVFVPSNVVPNKGELTVKNSATLAVFLSDALKYLFNYPYGSTEEIASKLQAMAIVKHSINLPNVSDKITLPATVSLNESDITVDEAMNRGLREIFKAQNPDGGFSYYPVKFLGSQGNSDIYMTLRVADALVDIKSAGYGVDNERLHRVKEFLAYRASLGGNQKLDDETFIVVAKTLSDLKEYGNLDGATIGRIKTILRNNKFLKEQISNEALGNLGVLLAREKNIFGSSAMNTVIDLLENRIQIDARGAYVSVNAEQFMWQYYETPIQDTSLLLQALVAAKRDDQILDRLVRWLVASRAKDGSWGSTVDTVTVVDTFSQFIAWRQETESNFTLKTSVDNVEKNSFTFKPETIFSQNQMVFPITDLAKDRPIAITFAKENIPPSGGMPRSGVSNNFYYDIALRYFLPIDQIAPRDEGFTITRNVYARNDLNYERPLTEGKVGDVLHVHGEIIVPRSRNFVAITDPIPAGASIVNTNLATEDQSLGLEQNANPDNPRYVPFGSGSLDWQYLEPKQYEYLYTDAEEARDDRFYAAVTHLEPGTYAYDYDIRLLTPGTFHYLPAVVSEIYFPENFGRTSGRYFTVKQ